MAQHKGREIYYMSRVLGWDGAKRVALALCFCCGEKATERHWLSVSVVERRQQSGTGLVFLLWREDNRVALA